MQAWSRPDNEFKWPFPRQCQDAQHQVYNWQDGEWLDTAIEVLGKEVEEDLGPEEPFEGGGNLIGGSREDDEARPVVLDEFTHGKDDGEDMIYKNKVRSRRSK